MENVAQENEKAISGAIKIDEKKIRTHLDGLVRQSVENTLNALLNAEADAICQTSSYHRSPDRQDTRAESDKRKLLTKAGEVELRVPRLRTLPFPLACFPFFMITVWSRQTIRKQTFALF